MQGCQGTVEHVPHCSQQMEASKHLVKEMRKWLPQDVHPVVVGAEIHAELDQELAHCLCVGSDPDPLGGWGQLCCLLQDFREGQEILEEQEPFTLFSEAGEVEFRHWWQRWICAWKAERLLCPKKPLWLQKWLSEEGGGAGAHPAPQPAGRC